MSDKRTHPRPPVLDPSLRQLCTVHTLVREFGVTRQAIFRRIKVGACFPPPVAQLQSGHRLWDRCEVELAAKMFPERIAADPGGNHRKSTIST